MRTLLLASLLALAACARSAPPPAAPPPLDDVEAVSLSGKPLVAPELPAEVRRDREALLAEAKAAAEARPDDADALIWLGRRTAYLGRYREAIEIFSRGVTLHPRDARFLRHRSPANPTRSSPTGCRTPRASRPARSSPTSGTTSGSHAISRAISREPWRPIAPAWRCRRTRTWRWPPASGSI
jgi:hypothetical protein